MTDRAIRLGLQTKAPVVGTRTFAAPVGCKHPTNIRVAIKVAMIDITPDTDLLALLRPKVVGAGGKSVLGDRRCGKVAIERCTGTRLRADCRSVSRLSTEAAAPEAAGDARPLVACQNGCGSAFPVNITGKHRAGRISGGAFGRRRFRYSVRIARPPQTQTAVPRPPQPLGAA